MQNPPSSWVRRLSGLRRTFVRSLVAAVAVAAATVALASGGNAITATSASDPTHDVLAGGAEVPLGPHVAGFFGGGLSTASHSRGTILPIAGTASQLHVEVIPTQHGPIDVHFEVRKNNEPTDMRVHIFGSGAPGVRMSGHDATHQVAFAPGDAISIVIGNGTPEPFFASWSLAYV